MTDFDANVWLVVAIETFRQKHAHGRAPPSKPNGIEAWLLQPGRKNSLSKDHEVEPCSILEHLQTSLGAKTSKLGYLWQDLAYTA
jgi:hypothetical protein